MGGAARLLIQFCRTGMHLKEVGRRDWEKGYRVKELPQLVPKFEGHHRGKVVRLVVNLDDGDRDALLLKLFHKHLFRGILVYSGSRTA